MHLLESGKIRVKELITGVEPFESDGDMGTDEEGRGNQEFDKRASRSIA